MSIGGLTSAPFVNSLRVTQRTQGNSLDGHCYSDEQIRQFVQSNQDDPKALVLQASSMGLNSDQVQHALNIGGINIDIEDINICAMQQGYDINAKGRAMGVTSQDSSAVDKGTNAWSPTQNRWITPSEVNSFLDTNPSDRQIFEHACALGLTAQDLNTALRGQGYTGQALGQHYNRLTSNLYTGGLGYSTDTNGTFDGRIVVGGGHTSVEDKNGGSYWLAGKSSPIVFGPNGIEAGDNYGTNNWSVKNGYIGAGTAGKGSAGNVKGVAGTANDTLESIPITVATESGPTFAATTTNQISNVASYKSTVKSLANKTATSVALQASLGDSRAQLKVPAEQLFQRLADINQKSLGYGAASVTKSVGGLLSTEA